MLEGGCLCGFVRYRVRGRPSHETLCHCSICRRASGAPVVAWFTVRRADLVVVSGEPATFRSSDHGTRTFCPRCGTPLAFRSARLPDEVDVTTCSLDAPERVAPRDHTHAAARLGWLVPGDDLPRHPAERDAEPGPT